ncbi:hypothetical protein F4680DRAFT_432223 [Xylaria scruposa]|nr:hypothetical protein F4680DRAFT_432223 [Xylaria scruposa]
MSASEEYQSRPFRASSIPQPYIPVDNTWSFGIGLKPPPQPSSLLESPPQKSFLDPEGDLCLQVGESPATSFIVCSRTLARASLVWNVMLNGEFKESKRFRSREEPVDLPEDDPRPMALLLNIIHGRFDRVPSYDCVMNIRDLYDISVVTDKYDMAHVLRPWASGWLRSTHRLNKWPHLSLREQYCHERLWIYWELGDKVNFEKIANGLLLNSSTLTEDADSLRCKEAQEPPDIYEILEQTRLSIIEELLTALDNIIQGLIQKDKRFCSKKSKKESQKGQGDCLASMLGTGIQSLYGVGLWPLPQPASVQCSVLDLSAKLKTVEIEGYIGEYHRCSQKLSLQNKVEGILRNIPSLLTEGHKSHLESQAKKSGVSPIGSDTLFNHGI